MGCKAPRKRLTCRVISAFTRVFDALWHVQRVPRTHPNVSRRFAHPSTGVSEAKRQTPGAKKRAAGTRECGLIELVRWECNPTIDYACPGCGAARSGAQLIRDRHALERSTQVGFTRLAHIGRRSRVNPRSVSAEKQENTGIGPTSAALASLEASS
jgi:hypothetical protein